MTQEIFAAYPTILLGLFIIAAISILIFIEKFLVERNKDRFKNLSSVFLRRVIIFYLIFCAGTVIAILIKPDKIDLIMGIHTGLLGLAGGLLFNVRDRFNDKTVCIISKSKNNFSQALTKACEARLQTEPGIKVKIIPLEALEDYNETADFQEKAIMSQDVIASDALVLIPATPTPKLAERIIELHNLGIYVVTCDHKISNEIFFKQNSFPPSFVTSDFCNGGRLIGEEIAISATDPEDVIVVITGPRFSSPGTIRSENCIKAIVRAEKLRNLQLFEIDIWHPKEASAAFINFVEKSLIPRSGIQSGKGIHVFCANDEICREINSSLEKRHDLQTYKWSLYGYDGIKDNSGDYILAFCQFARATVDQNISEIGNQIGGLLIEKYTGISNTRRRKVVVEPILVKFGQDGDNSTKPHGVVDYRRPSLTTKPRKRLETTQRVPKKN